MTLEGHKITERYIGKRTKTYVGHYETDGFKCNCSWYQSRLLCRHPFVYRIMNNLPLFDINIFHPTFKLNNDAHEPSELVNESVEMFDLQDNVNSRLGSPGMEYLIEEEQEANKKLKKNVKFNKAFDVAKVAAEYISMYSTDQFKKNLETFKQFTELLRTGLPDDVVNVLKKYSEPHCDESDNHSVGKEVVVHGLNSDNIVLDKMTGIISSQTNIRNVREENCHLIPKDHGVYPIPGDGSFFFGSLAAHIYQDETQVSILRSTTTKEKRKTQGVKK